MAEKAFEGSVPGDIAREKQAELSTQLATIQGQRARQAQTSAEHEGVIRNATALLPHCGEAYRRGNDTIRRDYNQAWFEQVLVDSDRGQPTVTGVTRTALFEALRGAEVRAETRAEAGQQDQAPSVSIFQQALSGGSDGTGQNEEPGRFRARVIHRVGGSKVALLVGLTEQLSRCSASLADLQERTIRTLGAPTPGSRTKPRVRHQQRRLTASETVAVAREYQAGADIRVLAGKYGVHRTTISTCLAKLAIPRRQVGLPPENIPEAARLYQEGWSLARLSGKFGCTDNTVRARLLEVGVVMRSRRGGRKRHCA